MILSAAGIASAPLAAAEPVIDKREILARAVLKSTAVEWSAVLARRGHVCVPPRAIS